MCERERETCGVCVRERDRQTDRQRQRVRESLLVHCFRSEKKGGQRKNEKTENKGGERKKNRVGGKNGKKKKSFAKSEKKKKFPQRVCSHPPFRITLRV